MIGSRSYRKAVSFVTLSGRTYRLTDGFMSLLAITIGRAENLRPTDVHYVMSTAGATPMTLSELYELRDAIAKLVSDTQQIETIAND